MAAATTFSLHVGGASLAGQITCLSGDLGRLGHRSERHLCCQPEAAQKGGDGILCNLFSKHYRRSPGHLWGWRRGVAQKHPRKYYSCQGKEARVAHLVADVEKQRQQVGVRHVPTRGKLQQTKMPPSPHLHVPNKRAHDIG
eukprot:CAMPEP_0117462866 /NCGR_PEP_ID=MMETSP0784-20121206/3276_1 /TAXON_ID=39447 /ORGANISM="" /LENGTH=140 /DNA_ID=CAMNT_0005256647 /DNA_START=395 /DNA_END=820 /DNA_ORIENTATION=+